MMRRAFCLSFCLMAAAVCVRAQCPKITIKTNAQNGDMMTVFVDVTGVGHDVTPTYNWTVSAGTISSGQGTSAITVDTTGDAGKRMTAAVDLGGFPAQCNTHRTTTIVIQSSIRARKFDEYGPLPRRDENARLDNLAIELQNDPTTKAYVIVYGGPKSPPSSAAARLRMAKTYLVQTRAILSERIVTVNGGKRTKPATELWIVPEGAQPPGTPLGR